jgi:hypothetical protein
MDGSNFSGIHAITKNINKFQVNTEVERHGGELVAAVLKVITLNI